MVAVSMEMEATDDETPFMALLRICGSSPWLAHHPDLAPALVRKDLAGILSHLRQQRQWFSNLRGDARDRLDLRKARSIQHAREACAALSRYEERLRFA